MNAHSHYQYQYESHSRRAGAAAVHRQTCLPFADLQALQRRLQDQPKAGRAELSQFADKISQALAALQVVPASSLVLQEVSMGLQLMLHLLSRMEDQAIPCSSLHALLEPIQNKLDAALERLTDVI